MGLARGGLVNDRRFGYDRALAGLCLWVTQPYLVCDVAALNKVELLIGDR